jgi:polyhydroxybutyrate depolymerase
VIRRSAVGVVPLLLSLLVGCGDDGGWTRTACSPAKPQPAGTVEVSFPEDGRRALVHVPEAYDGTEAYPLVFSWHGYGSTAEDHLAYADFRPLAESEHFLVVVPQGAGSPSRFNLGAGIVGDTDDAAFADRLIDRVAADYCLDTARVYSTGVSNGGGMSAVLACERGDRFAAVSMDALLLFPDGCGRAVPVLGMMGDADLVVPIQGGEVNCCGGWSIDSAVSSMQRWAAHAQCTSSDEDDVEDHVVRTRWEGCADDVAIEYWLIEGGGHTWPGAADTSQLGPTNQEIDASEVMWDFFKRFALRAPEG